MNLQEILAAIALLNQTLPAATGLILSLKNADGTVTPLNKIAEETLDKVDEVTAKNIEEAEAFLNRNKG